MIEAVSLTKRYGSTLAVDDLSFTVQPGTVTGFLGPNGAGKSTTMRMILGLDRPTSGHVLVNGQKFVGSAAPLHEIGALLEARAAHPGRSASAHLLALAATHRLGKRRVLEVLELVGLTEVAKKRVGTFSLGMTQRLGIAAALIGDPRTVMLDEPINGLDPEGIRWVRSFARSLAAEGRTVFISSHLMGEMSQTADRLIVIGRGRLVADTTMAQFLDRAGGGSVTVRSPQIVELADRLRAAGGEVRVTADEAAVSGLDLEQVGRIIAGSGLPILELSQQEASLEDAFMRLTADSVEFRSDVPDEKQQEGRQR